MKPQLVFSGIFVSTLLVVGCAGRPANPVLIQQFGDDKKSCEVLEQEMSHIQGEIQKLIPQTEKTGKNVALGVTGVFFIVPLFFMDLTQSEQEEVNAYRQRYNHLLIIATQKNCGVTSEPIPEFDKPTSTDSDTGDVKT